MQVADTSLKERLRQRVISRVDLTGAVADDEIGRIIDECILDETKDSFIPLKEKIQLRRELFNSFRRLDVLTEYLEEEDVSEIMVNGQENIFIEKNGYIVRTDKGFDSMEKLNSVTQQIVADCNRRINEANPIVDARLRDGSRVNIVMNPISLSGPAITIRKFPKEVMDMRQLCKIGSLTRELADFLEVLVKSRYNIFISGGTGSGKTTFLNALSDFIPKDERLITIEDSAELKISGVDNLVRLETRNPNMSGEGEITIRDLIKTSLRMRPDRIIVGEVRDAAAIDMLQAMGTGHDGSISTGHANSGRDMLTRLETMVLMGMELPIIAIRKQIASSVDIIIHLGRLRDRSRKVLSIDEVLGMKDGEIELNRLYEFVESPVESGNHKVNGKLEKINELVHMEKIMTYGMFGMYREVCSEAV
jgi:pilus assembly protein CpaF